MRLTQADQDWSEAVKIIAKYRCEKCGVPEPLNSHHFIGRVAKSVKYDIKNGWCLCVGCHRYAHNRPSEFSDWARSKRGELWYQLLKEKSRRLRADVTLDLLICKQMVKNKD